MISAQLYAESYIYAVGGKTRYDQNRRPRATGHCALAAYMWAYERLYMAKLAKVFQAKGIGQITTVGSLQLQVQMVASMIEVADQLALALCLEPPMVDYASFGSSVPAYVDIVHRQRAGGNARYQSQEFSMRDWIHDPAALVHLTSFSFLKAGSSLNSMLALDAMSCDPSRREEARQIEAKAFETVRTRMLGGQRESRE